MTIAACYVSTEGVVLGADSTASWPNADGSMRHYNNAQKLFEVGETGSTLGIVTWGIGGLPGQGYRGLIADLSDSLLENCPNTTQEAAVRWRDIFWAKYSTLLQADLAVFHALQAKPNRTPQEQQQLFDLRSRLLVGFCIAGRVRADRRPSAFQVLFDPFAQLPPAPTALPLNQATFWGVPNMMERLLQGIDINVYNRILHSGHWNGSQQDLNAIIIPQMLNLPIELPLREAIDWIFSSIFVTIKSMKFSSLAAVCGGPIEIATVTADRRFRWVCHKGLDQALWDHSARGKY